MIKPHFSILYFETSCSDSGSDNRNRMFDVIQNSPFEL